MVMVASHHSAFLACGYAGDQERTCQAPLGPSKHWLLCLWKALSWPAFVASSGHGHWSQDLGRWEVHALLQLELEVDVEELSKSRPDAKRQWGMLSWRGPEAPCCCPAWMPSTLDLTILTAPRQVPVAQVTLFPVPGSTPGILVLSKVKLHEIFQLVFFLAAEAISRQQEVAESQAASSACNSMADHRVGQLYLLPQAPGLLPGARESPQ
mmetsp:Transcript_34756/g.63232  ORF Transcript_34756/g.63232 Transcript_34756/m.63232 type:complete len:210 (-) Transcript_34756:66-695(-)